MRRRPGAERNLCFALDLVEKIKKFKVTVYNPQEIRELVFELP